VGAGRHLQGLLRAAYCEIYSAQPEDVEFILVPMPRLEIETIQDFKILHEIGALTPDMTIKLSRILLGEEPGAAKKRARTAAGPSSQASEPFPERQARVGDGGSVRQAPGQPPDNRKGQAPDADKKAAPRP
jgi:hypothetical protein